MNAGVSSCHCHFFILPDVSLQWLQKQLLSCVICHALIIRIDDVIMSCDKGTALDVQLSQKCINRTSNIPTQMKLFNWKLLKQLLSIYLVHTLLSAWMNLILFYVFCLSLMVTTFSIHFHMAWQVYSLNPK